MYCLWLGMYVVLNYDIVVCRGVQQLLSFFDESVLFFVDRRQKFEYIRQYVKPILHNNTGADTLIWIE